MIPMTMPPARPGFIEAIATTGQSDEARRLQALVGEIRDQQSVRAIFADLDTACSEAAVEDWNGHGGLAVQPGSFRYARSLLAVLLLAGLEPEITVDADGEVEFDWLASAQRGLSLSVGADGRLTFAWADGLRRGHGTEWFTGGIPAPLAAALGDVTRAGGSA